MKFHKYLLLNDIFKFRGLSIGLVEHATNNIEVVKHIKDQGLLDDSVLVLLERANAELKKSYRGKMIYDLCAGQPVSPDNLKIDEDKAKKIKQKWFEFNNELSEIQLKLESELRNK